MPVQEQLAEQLRKHEALETTFKPQTLEYPGVASRLDAMQSSALHKALQEQREQQRIANLQASEVCPSVRHQQPFGTSICPMVFHAV